MSDLISRSELLKAFNNKNVQITFDLPVEEVLGEDVDLDDFAMLVQDAIQAYKKMVIDTIKIQQTAYYVDKVVEELETERKTANNTYNSFNIDVDLGRVFGLEKAIEIVKQGVVSDDECEWKIVDRPHNLPIYNTSCGKIRLQYAIGIDIYCSGCGKKIKVVQ